MTVNQLNLDPIFQANMVLPRGKAWSVSGTAQPLSTVTLTAAGQKVTVQATVNGRFKALMRPVTSADDTSMTVQAGNEQIILAHMHFGATYLFSGQSNIEFRLRDAATYPDTVAHFPKLNAYFYEVPQLEYVDQGGQQKPADLKPAHWLKITPESCGGMSAVAFYAAVRWQQAHPEQILGIVDCYKGGTSASAWIPVADLNIQPDLRMAYVDAFNQAIAGKTQTDFDREMAAWQAKVDAHNQALADYQAAHPTVSLSDAKNVVGHTPWPFPASPSSYLRPGGLRQTMLSQVLPFTFNAVVWYQGENDTDHADLYDQLLQLLLLTWRRDFDDRSLPFYIIQLPGYADGEGKSWAQVRQAQLAVTRTLPAAHLITIADTGEAHNIHPTDKQPVGTRVGRILADQGYPATPQLVVRAWTDQGILLGVTQTSTLHVNGKLLLTVINEASGQKELQPATINDQIIEVTGNFSQVAYGYDNFPHLVLFNECGDPVAPVIFSRKQVESWQSV